MTSTSGGSNTAGSAIIALASASLGFIAATFVFYALQRDTAGSDNTKADETKAKDEVGGNNNNLSAAYSCSVSPSDTVALIRHRRSIFPKQYSGEALSRDVINDMLEAARFAPSHKLTEAWRFVVFESEESRAELGTFMAEQYRSAQEMAEKEVLQAKYEKKMKNSAVSSHVFAVVVNTDSKNPAWEEIASVSMAVQNMLLVAAAHGAGAYWSSGSVVDGSAKEVNGEMSRNSITTVFNSGWHDILKLSENEYCLGLVFVGICRQGMKWPSGKRSDIDDKSEWR
ncbi:MAG: nitroreductase family protein [Alphaproteobacteria bacterium]